MKSPEFVVHGTASDTEGEEIRESGFRAKQGRATVSADLIYAAEWASNPEKRKTRSEREYKEKLVDPIALHERLHSLQEKIYAPDFDMGSQGLNRYLRKTISTLVQDLEKEGS